MFSFMGKPSGLPLLPGFRRAVFKSYLSRNCIAGVACSFKKATLNCNYEGTLALKTSCFCTAWERVRLITALHGTPVFMRVL